MHFFPGNKIVKHYYKTFQGKGGLCVSVCLCAQLCLPLCDPMDYSPPGSSVHGIFQARILKWVAMPSSRASSQPRDWTHVSYVSCIGRWVLYQTSEPVSVARSQLYFFSQGKELFFLSTVYFGIAL